MLQYIHVASGLQKHAHVAIHVLLVVLTSAGPIIFYMSTYSMLRSTSDIIAAENSFYGDV